MPQFINDFVKNLKERFLKLNKSQKVMLFTSSTIILLSVIIGIVLTTRPNYVSIFSGLDPKESAEIQKILQDQKIDSKVTNGGTTILVKDSDVDKAKMAAALSGYPKSSEITFEDALKLSSSMTATESDKRRTFIKLKESELQNALKEMNDYIEDATVSLSIPEDYTFALKDETNKPSASVKLTLKRSLSSDQVEGIQRFVAASVEGLAPENVVIIDNKGNYLSDNSTDSFDGISTKQLQIKIATKNDIEKKVKELLGNYVSSPEDVKVSVNLDMNFDMQKINETKYTPVLEDSGIVLSKKTTKEDVLNGSSASGVPGTNTNPNQNPPQYPLNTQNGQSSYSKTDETINYQNNEKKVETIKAPGTINYDNSSIAVVLYRYTTYRQEDYEKSNQAKNLSWTAFKAQNQNNKRSFLTNQKEVQNIINLVKSATGIQNVTVEGYEIPTFVDKPKTQIPLDYIYMLFAFLLLMAFALSLIIKAIKLKPTKQVELAGMGGVGLQAPTEEVVEEVITEVPKRRETPPIEEINIEEFGTNQYEKQLDRLIKEKPELVAQLLRNWLSEEWE